MALSDEREATGATDPPSPYCVPLYLTSAGRRAFHDEVREFAAQLGQQLEVQAHKEHRTDPEYTASDVREARRGYEQRVRDRAEGGGSHRGLLAAILLTIATVGINVMAGLLHSPWQIAIFVLFATAGVVGLVMTWRSRPRKGVPG